MKNLFISMLCIMFFMASCSMNHMQNDNAESRNIESLTVSNNMSVAGEYRAPSQDPPAGLRPDQCPQFVILGFDDNQFDDGMINMINIFDGKTNPAGTGQAATFDGAPVSATFFNTPGGRSATEEWTVAPETVASWQLAYQKGHEIGNHTYYHEHGLQFDVARWVDEMTRCTDYLVNVVGVPRNEIVGFRTPFLEYNPNTFTALKQVGLTYDCSFEGGWRYWPREDGSTLYWPYTMDDGKPAGSEARDFGRAPGVWQIPNDCTFFPDGSRTTGFDYNIWFSKSATKQQFVDALKHSLNQKYNGNRSPMKFGLHTNYYSDKGFESMKIWDPASVAKLKTTVVERTAAVAEFVDYALTFKDVRIVSAKQALQWIRTPVALGSGPVEKVIVTASSGLNGKLDKEGAVEVVKGSSVTFTAIPDAGYVVDTVTVNNQIAAMDNNKYTFVNLQANASIDVTFKQAVTYTINATSGANGSLDKEGLITVAEGSNVAFNAVPAAGYEVDTVTVDNAVVTNPVFPIAFNNVVADHSINVTFKKIDNTGVKAVYEITQDWGSGFGGKVTITNNSAAPINSWEVSWTYDGQEQVTSLWNATYTQVGNKVTVNNMSWNGYLGVGQSISFGFNGTYVGTNGVPAVITVK